MTKPKKRRKRKAPPLAMPGRIDASAEEIAETVLAAKPPPKWKYLEEVYDDGDLHQPHDSKGIRGPADD